MRIKFLFAVAGFVLVVAAGCGKKGPGQVLEAEKGRRDLARRAEAEEEGEKTVKVEGSVALDGRALGHVTVMFLPVNAGEGRPASGLTDEAGAFDLSTRSPGDGALPGTYVVTVTEAPAPPTGKDQPSSKVPLGRVPQRYAAPTTTPLKETVAPGKNRIVIQLKS